MNTENLPLKMTLKDVTYTITWIKFMSTELLGDSNQIIRVTPTTQTEYDQISLKSLEIRDRGRGRRDRETERKRDRERE